MTTSSVCPVCGNPQQHGIACSSCCDRLERDLGDVAAIVTELDTTMSKQAKIGAGSGSAGLARERMPIGLGAMEAADNLGNVLTTWARDVLATDNERWTRPLLASPTPAITASRALLLMIPTIRRHPAVKELCDEISDAIGQARRVVDRPADRIYLGQCYFEGEGVTCYEEIYGLPGASEVRCRVCGATHPVEERRDWLMGKAKDMLVTIKEASSYLGEIGGITISQASIRSYIHRQKISYKAPIEAKRFRLGDLLAVIGDDQERKSA